MQWPIVLSFSLVLLSFLLVGLSANFRARSTTGDYLMAGREVHPWLVGFAAAATNSSGFMFIGLIGVTVTDGLSAMWLMVGWIVGDYVAWLVVLRRLRERSGELQAQSVPGFLSAGMSQSFPIVRKGAALLTIVFLATYAAAQFTAGGKALEALLGWPRALGIGVGFGLLLLYCLGGGLRASIWVNTAQSFLMISSVLLLLTVAVLRIGGPEALWSKLAALDPKYVDWRPQNLRFGFPAYMLSWIAAGAGAIGQPHLMTIAMTIQSSDQMYRARRVYFVWYWIFSAACILVGLCCRAWLNEALVAGADPEMALPQLASELLPGGLVGVMLGGVFAATLSTADTQIICSSAALTQDLIPSWGRSYGGAKLGMVAMSLAVVATALFGPASVFELVVLSWSCLAASLGPLLAVQALRGPLNNFIGAAMMICGLGTALVWRYQLELSSSIYEVLPGMLAGFMVYGLLYPMAATATEAVPAPCPSSETEP
ncbi:MAG: sodium/proline symporter [Planctomycetales bacterium]